MSKIAVKSNTDPRMNPMMKHVTVWLVISCLMWKSLVGPPKLHLQLRNRTANITDTWTHSPVMVEVPNTTALKTKKWGGKCGAPLLHSCQLVVSKKTCEQGTNHLQPFSQSLGSSCFPFSKPMMWYLSIFHSFSSDLISMMLLPVLKYVAVPWVEWCDDGDDSEPSWSSWQHSSSWSGEKVVGRLQWAQKA